MSEPGREAIIGSNISLTDIVHRQETNGDHASVDVLRSIRRLSDKVLESRAFRFSAKAAVPLVLAKGVWEYIAHLDEPSMLATFPLAIIATAAATVSQTIINNVSWMNKAHKRAEETDENLAA